MSGEIKDCHDAKNVWFRFNNKYKNFSEGITSETKKHYQSNSYLTIQNLTRKALNTSEVKKVNNMLTLGVLDNSIFETSLQDSKLDKNSAATIIQRKWRNATSKNTLIPINHQGNHNSDFNHLVNN